MWIFLCPAFKWWKQLYGNTHRCPRLTVSLYSLRYPVCALIIAPGTQNQRPKGNPLDFPARVSRAPFLFRLFPHCACLLFSLAVSFNLFLAVDNDAVFSRKQLAPLFHLCWESFSALFAAHTFRLRLNIRHPSVSQNANWSPL